VANVLLAHRLFLAPQILAEKSQDITIFPGDVVTLGRTSDLLTLPGSNSLPLFTVRATTEGLRETTGTFSNDIVVRND
jgi:hypothetical protein